MRPILLLTLAFLASTSSLRAQNEGDYLYEVTLIRAAPGEFVALMDALRDAAEVHVEAGDESPFWMRHSQGDHWDFMLVRPVGSREAYHASDRTARRARAWGGVEGRDVQGRLEAATAYHEEWFARSVPLDVVRRRFDGAGFFHVEMFAGLPGSRAELVEQRRMENRYYEHLDRQQNLIFTRAGGSNWDVMTVGFFQDLQAFAAAGARDDQAEQEEAARAAGFDGVDHISPYLRSLLSYHNDTLATAVR